jgi:hypothetical protein
MSSSPKYGTLGAKCDQCGESLAWDDGWSVCPLGCGYISARCNHCGGLIAARKAAQSHRCAHARRVRYERPNTLVQRYAMARRWRRARTATKS